MSGPTPAAITTYYRRFTSRFVLRHAAHQFITLTLTLFFLLLSDLNPAAVPDSRSHARIHHHPRGLEDSESIHDRRTLRNRLPGRALPLSMSRSSHVLSSTRVRDRWTPYPQTNPPFSAMVRAAAQRSFDERGRSSSLHSRAGKTAKEVRLAAAVKRRVSCTTWPWTCLCLRTHQGDPPLVPPPSRHSSPQLTQTS